MFRPSEGGIFSHLLNDLNRVSTDFNLTQQYPLSRHFSAVFCKATTLTSGNDQHNGDKKEITINFPFLFLLNLT